MQTLGEFQDVWLCDVYCVYSPQGTRMFSFAAVLGFGVLVLVGLALPLILFILTTVCPQSAKYNDVYLEKKIYIKSFKNVNYFKIIIIHLFNTIFKLKQTVWPLIQLLVKSKKSCGYSFINISFYLHWLPFCYSNVELFLDNLHKKINSLILWLVNDSRCWNNWTASCRRQQPKHFCCLWKKLLKAS